MIKRLTIVSSVIALALVLGGCTKCGWFWDDWRSAPQTCKSDVPTR
jgi:PBP1b-binding outer membrane lipoprotein LpoB